MSLLFAELTATCNSLGYVAKDGVKYFLDKECKEAVRDLIRFLRRDDDSHEIRRYLGMSKILQTDLIPIVIHHHDDKELFDLLLRLLVNLTTPILLLYNEELPEDRMDRQYYLTMDHDLQCYKQAFVNKKIWTVLSDKLTELLNSEWHERGEERGLSIVRILILIRNILHVPTDAELEKRPDSDADTHDQILWALYEGGIINLILYVATSENEHQYYFHVLEIVSLMFRNQNAEMLASASIRRSLAEKEKDTNELMVLRKKEAEEKQKKLKCHIAARHSRFAGSYVVQGVKSIGNNDLVVHSIDKISSLSFDQNKARLKTPKNRRAMQYDCTERRSAFSVLLFLKEFCIEFLNGAYNNLMRYIREMLVRGKAQTNDESYYFWAVRFFMEFSRYNGFQVKLISETMSVQVFHFIQDKIENWRECMVTDKKKILLYSKRMHLALKAYKELLNTLFQMYQSKEKSIKESSHTIMSNLFYIVEYRELLMNLINIFDETKFSREYLKDLIETNHIYLKMLENFCKRHRTLVVQKKAKAVRTRKKKKNSKRDNAQSTECTLEQWETMKESVMEVLRNKGNIQVQVVPFDAASDKPEEEQKIDAMCKIKHLLVRKQAEEAVSLLLAAREVWPENDVFGSNSMSLEEECDSLKDIFLADIGNVADYISNESDSEDETENPAEEEREQAMNIAVQEQGFEFSDFLKRFIKPKIVYACCLLLSQFEKNTDHTNHCVLKLLHRIAYDCKYEAMLFQASVFRTFQRILSCDQSQHQELKKFAAFVVRKFVQVAEKNSKIYMELLFWKSSKEAYEVVEGYGSSSSITRGVAWTEEQEDELRRLAAEYERDKPAPDIVDWIHSNLINQDRSRRCLIKKLREMYLIPDKKAQRSTSSRPPKEFSEAEIAQITQLYHEFKNAFDPVGCIMERLDLKRPKKRIIDKIVELGLVQDRKELRKKRMKSKKGTETCPLEGGSSNAGDSSGSDSGRDDDNSEDESGDAEESSARAGRETEHVYSLSSKEVAVSVNSVLQENMHDTVRWLISCLEEAAEDIGDEESDIPLLPLSEESIKSMDSRIFKKMLLCIGIKKPLNEQEVYWRIPGTWNANDIRRRVEILKCGLDGILNSHPNEGENDTSVPLTNGDSSDTKKQDTVDQPASRAPHDDITMLENGEQQHLSLNDNGFGNGNPVQREQSRTESKQVRNKNIGRKKRTRKVQLVENSSSDDEEKAGIPAELKHRKKRRVQQIRDSSEEEEATTEQNRNDLRRVDSSEKSNIVQEKKHSGCVTIECSDSEEPESVVLTRNKKSLPLESDDSE